MEAINSELTEVPMLVFVKDAWDLTDCIKVTVKVTEAQKRDGQHYIEANMAATRDGWQPMLAVDSSHPVYKKVMDGEKFAKFFDDATLVLQDSLAGREVQPERTIQQVRDLYANFGDEMLYMAVSPEGFWDVKSGSWMQDPAKGTFFRNPDVAGRLHSSGPVQVAAYPIRVVAQTGMRDLPLACQIVGAAREALRVCKLLGKKVTAENSEEMLLQQMRAEKIVVPDHGKVLLKPLMESVRLQTLASQEINLDKPALPRAMRQAA